MPNPLIPRQIELAHNCQEVVIETRTQPKPTNQMEEKQKGKNIQHVCLTTVMTDKRAI
jgi:hypothetical protein